MLIDIHGHFGHKTPGAATPARLATYAGAAGVDLLLISNRDAAALPTGAPDLDEADANAVTLDACRTQPRLVPLYWVRPGRVDSHPTVLAGALALDPFAGALFAPAANNYEVTASLLEPYMAALAARGCPAVFCVSNSPGAAPNRIYDLARRYTTVPCVLCHCDATDAIRAASLDVARHARQHGTADLYLDTSHATADWTRGAVRALGGDRVLYGTNALSYGDAHMPRHIVLLEELRKSLSAMHFRQVTVDNAVRLFKLAERAAAPPKRPSGANPA
jgi:predicted TIM-barrel fold metal-dependent hydrolase